MYRIGAETLLAGSMHFLPEGAEIPAELNRAYESKSALVLEADFEGIDESLRYLEDGTLKDLVSENCYCRIQTAFERIGRDPAEAETLKPWACALQLQRATLERAGFSYEYGVETQLRSRAITDGKPIHSLEPPDTILRIYDAAPLNQQQHFLERTLEEIGEAPEMMSLMASAWRSGDDRTVERIVEGMPFSRLVLSLRNQYWTQGILNGLLAEPDALVTVGIGHLVGPGNLIRMLRGSGIKVSRI